MQLTTVLPAVFNRIRPGATLMSVIGYENNFGEVSDFGIVFHVNYRRAVEKALNTLMNYAPRNELERKARFELIQSYRSTLAGNNPLAKAAKAYSPIEDCNGDLIKGVKWHKAGREVHLWGFLVHKRIRVRGEYPEEHPSEQRLAKIHLGEVAKMHRFRQFKLIDGRFEHIGVAKLTLTQQDLVRDLQ